MKDQFSATGGGINVLGQAFKPNAPIFKARQGGIEVGKGTPQGEPLIPMKYKALFLDVDGTIIPNKEGATISEKVIETINKASKEIHVGLATTRPMFLLSDIINKINLSAPSIVNAGAEIADLSTGIILKEHIIHTNDLSFLLGRLQVLGLPIGLDDGKNDMTFEAHKTYHTIKKVFTKGLVKAAADDLIRDIGTLSTLAVHKVPSWEQGKFDLYFTNSQATKALGILQVAATLGISSSEIIGIGDGHNDLPFVIACGLKVAMGNAVEDLRLVADYIAPSAEEDGVADAIERFILFAEYTT
jgi:HAD superfamily hydrolase (TIGR01484 family)